MFGGMQQLLPQLAQWHDCSPPRPGPRSKRSCFSSTERVLSETGAASVHVPNLKKLKKKFALRRNRLPCRADLSLGLAVDALDPDLGDQPSEADSLDAELRSLARPADQKSLFFRRHLEKGLCMKHVSTAWACHPLVLERKEQASEKKRLAAARRQQRKAAKHVL